MKPLHSLVEERSIQDHGIVLEEVARAFYSENSFSEVQVFDPNGEYMTVTLRGLCKFYVPVNVGDEQGDAKQPFPERMRELSTIRIDDVDARRTRMLKGDLSNLLKESERYEKTELYNAYLQRYDKKYLVVIVGDVMEGR